MAAANRDPAVFANAGALDITRTDSKHHLALGFGPHFCLGNALARLEGAVVFESLARRFPDMAIPDLDPAWRGHTMLRGIEALPVVFGREHTP